MLCTNLFKKELADPNQATRGLALNCLSNVVTADLSRDLLPDILALMTSHDSAIRKKATLVAYKFILANPQGLRQAYPIIRERVNDPDPSVVSCAVNVVCELARKNAKNYLTLVPPLFQLLSMAANNWMLIKVVKLFGIMIPHEPKGRLARKIISPLLDIVRRSTAKSLVYECLFTLAVALRFTRKGNGSQPKAVMASGVIGTCIEKLRSLAQSPDQNLKYLGLVGLSELLKAEGVVLEQVIRDGQTAALVLSSLRDADITIRLRSLSIVAAMADENNLHRLVARLMSCVFYYLRVPVRIPFRFSFFHFFLPIRFSCIYLSFLSASCIVSSRFLLDLAIISSECCC